MLLTQNQDRRVLVFSSSAGAFILAAKHLLWRSLHPCTSFSPKPATSSPRRKTWRFSATITRPTLWQHPSHTNATHVLLATRSIPFLLPAAASAPLKTAAAKVAVETPDELVVVADNTEAKDTLVGRCSGVGFWRLRCRCYVGARRTSTLVVGLRARLSYERSVMMLWICFLLLCRCDEKPQDGRHLRHLWTNLTRSCFTCTSLPVPSLRRPGPTREQTVTAPTSAAAATAAPATPASAPTAPGTTHVTIEDTHGKKKRNILVELPPGRSLGRLISFDCLEPVAR